MNIKKQKWPSFYIVAKSSQWFASARGAMPSEALALHMIN